MRSWQGGRSRHLRGGGGPCLARRGVPPAVRMDRPRPLARAGGQRGDRQLLDLFWDDATGGFFTTGSDAEALVVRPKEFLDGAVPASNSIAVSALLRANAFVDDPSGRRRDRAYRRRWPARCSSATRARWPTWWRPLPMWSGRRRDRDHRGQARPARRGTTALATRGRPGVGRARRRPALHRTPVGAGAGLRLPGARMLRRPRAEPGNPRRPAGGLTAASHG